jgi:hypothetical protein
MFAISFGSTLSAQIQFYCSPCRINSEFKAIRFMPSLLAPMFSIAVWGGSLSVVAALTSYQLFSAGQKGTNSLAWFLGLVP